jgi:hypothetical protein
VLGQRLRKFIGIEIGELPFALIRERIEPFKFSVDEAGMTHDQPAIRQPGQKARKNRREGRLATEIIGAGKGRIGGDTKSSRLAAEADAQNIDQQFLAALEPLRRPRAAALPHPGLGRHLRRHPQHGVAHLRKQMHVLMTIDEVGWPAESLDEGLHLGRDFAGQLFAIEPAHHCRAHNALERQELAAAHRCKILAQWLERRGQGDVQAQQGALAPGIEVGKRRGFIAAGMRRRRHYRRRIEAPAQDQFADCGIDRR